VSYCQSGWLVARPSYVREPVRARRVDAIVVVTAEPDGTVLSDDLKDLRALALYSDGVQVLRA